MIPPPTLSGQSGSTLRIFVQQGRTIVRKSSHAEQGNARLCRQMEKQQAFTALHGPINAPAILDSGTAEDGRFYFDMEFVAGLDGHRFLEKCSPAELRSFSGKLSEFLSTIPALPVIGQPGPYPSLFEACVFKLTEIHQRQVGLSDELAGRILGSLAKVRQLEVARQGFCHGDFTLENILVNTRGDLIFVDFLDSTFEHPVQDLVKLSQDILGGWFRLKGRRISAAFIASLDEMLRASAETVFPDYPSVRNVLQALNFCRILPYVVNAAQKDFVMHQIHKFSELAL